MRAALNWIVAALVLLLAGVLVDTARAAPREGLRHAISPYLIKPLPGAPIQAVVLVQRRDCSGNIRLLDLMQRPSVQPNIRLAVIWYVGPATDSVAIRQLLPAWTAHVPLAPVPTEAMQQLRQLGHNETPTLVVLDQDARIRLTTRSPRSLREFAGLRQIIEGLTWIGEL